MVSMYFVAIILPPHLDEKVLRYKNHMLENFGCRTGLKSPAHITLVPPFWMDVEKEEFFIRDLDLVCAELSPFSICTQNFSAFKPATIFIATAPNDRLNQVKKSIDDFINKNPEYKIRADKRPFHPHITIATRDLFKKNFYEAWPWFEKKLFEEEWTAGDMCLLKHDQKKWDVIHTSPFKNIY